MASAPSGAASRTRPAAFVDGDDRLRELGYRPRLERGLSTVGSVVLTLSDITPAGSLLIVGLAPAAPGRKDRLLGDSLRGGGRRAARPGAVDG